MVRANPTVCRYAGQCDRRRCRIQFTGSELIETTLAVITSTRNISSRRLQTPTAQLMLGSEWMLTAFRHCLLTCPARAYIVRLILVRSVGTRPSRQTMEAYMDRPTSSGCCCCRCYSQRRSRSRLCDVTHTKWGAGRVARDSRVALD